MGVSLSSASSDNINRHLAKNLQSGVSSNANTTDDTSQNNRRLGRICAALTKCMLFRSTSANSEPMRREPSRSNLSLHPRTNSDFATGYKNQKTLSNVSDNGNERRPIENTPGSIFFGNDQLSERTLLSE